LKLTASAEAQIGFTDWRNHEELKLSDAAQFCRLHLDSGLWTLRAALGEDGWLCAGFWDWRWNRRFAGRMVVIMKDDKPPVSFDTVMQYLSNLLAGVGIVCALLAAVFLLGYCTSPSQI